MAKRRSEGSTFGSPREERKTKGEEKEDPMVDKKKKTGGVTKRADLVIGLEGDDAAESVKQPRGEFERTALSEKRKCRDLGILSLRER